MRRFRAWILRVSFVSSLLQVSFSIPDDCSRQPMDKSSTLTASASLLDPCDNAGIVGEFMVCINKRQVPSRKRSASFVTFGTYVVDGNDAEVSAHVHAKALLLYSDTASSDANP